VDKEDVARWGERERKEGRKRIKRDCWVAKKRREE